MHMHTCAWARGRMNNTCALLIKLELRDAYAAAFPSYSTSYATAMKQFTISKLAYTTGLDFSCRLSCHALARGFSPTHHRSNHHYGVAFFRWKSRQSSNHAFFLTCLKAGAEHIVLHFCENKWEHSIFIGRWIHIGITSCCRWPLQS